MGDTTPGLNIFKGVPLLPTKATGRIYFVGNAAVYVPGGVAGVDAAGHGDSPQHPFASMDYANGQCAANRGDTVYVLPGHVEDVTAAAGLDLDVAGVTFLFLGDGATRATIRFGTAVGADMDVDAANVTLGARHEDLGPRFLANIDALTGPIDVNAARFRMFGAKWYDGTTINTTDVLVADANADNMEIEDFEFVDGDAAGTQKQSFIQVAGATGVIIRKIKCTGDFGTGIIENGTAWVDALLDDLLLDNASASPTVCLLLQATSTGWVRNASLRVASGATGYTANNDMQFHNVGVVGTDALAAGDDVLGSTSTAAATGAVTTTDTAMAYIKQIVTMIGTDADTNALAAMLGGAAGIATMPNAAVPATGVNVFELLHELWAVLNGTAAGENGVQVWPAAAVPGNNVSIAEVLRDVWDVVRNGTGGAEPATNRSVMDYLGVSPAFYQPQLGYLVTKVGDVASAPDDLFTVTGKVLVTLMHGEVTSVIATTQSLTLTTSTGTQTIAAVTQIAGDGVGTLYMVSGDPDLALNGATTPGIDAALLTNGSLAPFIINDDRIYQSINGAGTGTIQWDLWYVPLEASASVASSS